MNVIRDNPGEFPFTRGIYPDMYKKRLWTMRQYSGFGSAEDTNKRYKYLLEQGQTGLSVAFDLPTQLGYDSDNALCIGEVGKAGVAIDTLADMELLFKDIPLGKVSTSMTINATAAILLAMYIAVGEKQGVKTKDLSGTIQNDILKEYTARGTYIFPPKPSMRLIVDSVLFCKQHLPYWNTMSISGYHMREAGCTAAQEIGFTLANAIEYVQTLIDANIKVDKFADRLSFFFSAHNNLFEEVAKFRAARRLWSQIMKYRFSATKEKSMMMRFHTQTAGCTLTAQQPENNIIRIAIQTLAAVGGGTQSLHTNSFDEALSLPSKEAVTTALRTQQIIAHESGISNAADPFGGSYYVEDLTDSIEDKAVEYIATIDNLGGATKAIKSGYIQEQIQTAAYEYQLAIENKNQTVVGVNKYKSDDVELPIFKLDKVNETSQISKLQEVKRVRDEEEVKVSLEVIKFTAKSSANLMLPILNAVKSYCTIGEISNILREVFGEHQENILV